MNTWNSAFNECMKLKHNYIDNFGDLIHYDFKEMVEIMKEHKNEYSEIEYNEMFDVLQINQEEDLVLIRYGLHELGRGLWEDKNSPLREARSLVFDIRDEKIVLCPFRKFFNLNEVEETTIENIERKLELNNNNFEVSNKLDGSMQSFTYYKDSIIGSGSMALSEEKSFRLKEGYSMLSDNHKRLIKDLPHMTFIFEYISDKDKHVVSYDYEKDKGLHLIGMRDKRDGIECSYETIDTIASLYKIKCCKTYAFNNLWEVLNHIKKMTVDDGEGFVLNVDGLKIKIKCEDYVQLHRLSDKMSSPNVIIKAFADGTIDDLCANMTSAMLNKNADTLKLIENYMVNIKQEIWYYYEIIKKLDNRKISKKDIMRIINFFPSYVKEYVRAEYLQTHYNVLKGRGYKKLSEIENILNKIKNDKY